MYVWQQLTANKLKRADEGIKTFVSLYNHLWVTVEAQKVRLNLFVKRYRRCYKLFQTLSWKKLNGTMAVIENAIPASNSNTSYPVLK